MVYDTGKNLETTKTPQNTKKKKHFEKTNFDNERSGLLIAASPSI